ncbi:tandem-95 repeat protein [Novipirellula rosea]|uniref:Cadherin domain-containing protein n=1 Tax=Novipirellula rosea TaxID=1031540 RepID=A0ABP8MGN3_9BACT
MTQRRNFRKSSPLSKKTSRRLHHETLERRELLAASLGASDTSPELIALAANSGELFDLEDNNVLKASPTELTFRFDGGQRLDPNTLSSIRFTAAGGDGSFSEGNEVSIVPGYLGFEDESGTRIVVARFAETLPDDQYLVQIAGFDDTNQGIVGLKNNLGELLVPPNPADPDRPFQDIRFEVEVGPRVVAVVPQPVEGVGAARTQLRDTVYVYFNNDPLSNPSAGPISTSTSSRSVVNPTFYQLVFSQRTVENTDDAVYKPSNVVYDPALNRAVLTFDADLSKLPNDASGNLGPISTKGAGSFRLRIGSGEALPSAPTSITSTSDAGDVFAGAMPLSVSFGNGTDSVVIDGGMIRSTTDIIPSWPGAGDVSGIRDNRRDSATVGRYDTNTGVDVYFYNFANRYGVDPQNNPLDNAITEAQKQRAREVLSLYADRLGVQFIESENRGLQIVTGDLRAIADSADTGGGDTPYSLYRVNDFDPTQGVLVLDAGENWFDGYGLSPDGRPAWFVEAVRGIGSLLGIGPAFHLPPGSGAGGSSPDEPNSLAFTDFYPNLPVEPDFLAQSDISVGQALHRPESNDVDFYSFSVTEDGRITAETFAQRLEDGSLLDTHLTLYRVVDAATQQYELVASNGDFYGNDSLIGLDIVLPVDNTGAKVPSTYVLGVSSVGNESYNGNVNGSGLGGRTEGSYQLRVTFVGERGATITDTNNSRLDGDADGKEGGNFNFWFRVANDTPTPAVDEPRVIFVSKDDGTAFNSGTLSSPLRTISDAFAKARPFDIVRLLPSGGGDGLIQTVGDNLAYEIGIHPSKGTLEDGADFKVPQGVTVMADAGAIFKLFKAKIGVGSESTDEDRSLAAFQVLGTPLPSNAAGDPLIQNAGTVYFTSYDDESLGVDTNVLNSTPAPGEWGGIEFRNDFDYSEGRGVWETEGIFLDYVSHATITYGGGSLTPNTPIVTPVAMYESRPTVIYNTITDSAEAAISADPNSFLETNFHAPTYQRVQAFTSDYDRVGPDLVGNVLSDNSINGLFVRVRTPAVGQLEPMTVSGRMDDKDIVHVISQVLVLQGEPGGPILLEDKPSVRSVTLSDATGGTLVPNTPYSYRLTYVTEEGNESLASLDTTTRPAGSGGAIVLNNLPAAPAEFAGRRLYRLDPVSGDYVFVTQLNRKTSSYTDRGATRGGLLPTHTIGNAALLPRFNARLSVDPGLVVKLQSARIEATFGADFYAEGTDGNRVIFTSRLDDSYGAGGTFDTNDDADLASSGVPTPGDWGGLVFRQGSTASLDFVEIAYGGGTTPIEGGFTEFNAVEILQSDVRIANSTLRRNASGFVSQSIRGGRGFNDDSTIFVRGAQPTIVDNVITDNLGAAISINPNALNFESVLDQGRSTGPINIVATDLDNQGPLVSGNELDGNMINGMRVRSEILTTESVWDDTDIVHVVEGEIDSLTHAYRGGLRLKSDPNQSLVVKFGTGATLVGGGRTLDINDRIGGTLQVIGSPGNPVVLTSLNDNTVGAGFTPDGVAQNDTLNTGSDVNTAAAGDWAGLEIQALANDRNVAYVLEQERAVPSAILQNASASIFSSELVGTLARHQYAGDENERLGFNIRGTLAANNDVDVYRFNATGGTEVFVDIDDTSFGLDTVVELIDVNGKVLVRSDNSFAESRNRSLVYIDPSFPAGSVNPLYRTGDGAVESPNALDAGFRVVLDGSTSQLNTYRIRVRSANAKSAGQYQLSLRLREADEVAGSTVQLADIRYATNAITLAGAPLHSPLTGDATDKLRNGAALFDPTPNSPNSGDEFIPEDAQNRLGFNFGQADPLGNLLSTDRGSLVVSGMIGNIPDINQLVRMEDVDVYQVDLQAQQIAPDVFDSENRFVTTTFDVDYADGLGRVNTSLSVYDSQGRLILHSRDSNIADDTGRPLKGDDATNLTGGSVGTLDAYIGPVELPEGRYYVAVSSAMAVPAALNQFFSPNAVNNDVRLMPINSVRRIADEAFDGTLTAFFDADFEEPFVDQFANYTADASVIESLFDKDSFVPYTLDDMRLFVNYDDGLTGSNRSTLVSFNPFTGVLERTIGDFGPATRDLAMRDDGELFAYSTAPPTGNSTNGNIGNLLNISSLDGAANSIGDDGLTFQRNNANVTDLENDDNAQFIVEAMTYPLPSAFLSSEFDGGVNNRSAPTDGESFFAVGSRDTSGRGEVPFGLRTNLLYEMQTNSGEALSNGSTNNNQDRTFTGTFPYSTTQGPASDEFELGVIDTGNINGLGGDGGTITGIGFVPNSSSNFYAVTNLGGVHLVNPFTTTAADSASPAAGYNSVIPTTFYGVVPIDPTHAASTGQTFPRFTGMTMGPQRIEGQAFQSTMFATTDDGWLYAFKIENNKIVPANVFFNGRSALALTTYTGISISDSPTGLAFSTLEASPWHQTSDRGNEFGHGTDRFVDNTRIHESGGDSLYYGFEINGNAANNTIERPDGDNLGTLAPGGSHGSVISRGFSLEGYSASDKPTLYFTYRMEVEGDDDYNPDANGRLQNDSFRVFGSGDDGKWVLLATNNNFRELPRADEYDYFNESGIPVQELFDDADAWRQARVDIAPLAGSKNVRLRFDFSTAGAMRAQYDSFELVATDGSRLRDHQEFSILDNSTAQTVFFENIIGKDIVLPAGSALKTGDSFSVQGPAVNGVPQLVTITFTDTAPAGPGEVLFNPSQTAAEVAAEVFKILPKSLQPYNEGAGRISLLAASAVTIFGDSPVAQSNPVQVEATATEVIVPDGSSVVANEQITFEGETTSTTIQLVTAAGTVTDPAVIEIVYSPTNTAVQIAERILAVLPTELDAVSRGDGTITFLAPVLPTLGTLTSGNTITTDVAINENRFAISLPDGDNLVDGEALDIVSPMGVTTRITFVKSPFASPGQVNFQDGESAQVISERLVRALPSGLSALLDYGNSGDVLVNATSVSSVTSAAAIGTASVAALNIGVPNGAGLIDGEVISINAPGNPTITFIQSTGTAPAGQVYFQPGDNATTIANRVAAALPNNVDKIVNGTLVTFYGATNASSNTAGSNINLGPRPAQEVRLPAGVSLTDGETLTLVASGVTTVITFNNSATAPGPLEVNYQTTDTAAQVASKLLAALPTSFNGLITFSDPTRVRLLATSATAGAVSSQITVATTVFNDTTVLNLGIADGINLVDGESITVFAGGRSARFTFIESGSGTTPGFGFTPIIFDDTDTAADLYGQIISILPVEMQAFVDINGNGINVARGGFPFAFISTGASSFTIATELVNETSVPITLPEGSQIVENETINILAKNDVLGTNRLTFKFVTAATATGASTEIVYDPAWSAAEVANAVLAALPLRLQGYLESNQQINLLNALSVTSSPGSAIVGFSTNRFNAIPVQLSADMDSSQVAQRLRISLAEGLGRLVTTDGSNNATADNFKLYGDDRIRIFNAQPVNTGPYGSSYYDRLGNFYDSPLPADEFGERRSSSVSNGAREVNSASNNVVEGIYIDDIIVGFAERGEMVMNAPNNNTTFVFNPETLPDSDPRAIQPERQNETLVGKYSLEIRTSDEYGVPEDYDPINLKLDVTSSSGRTFDTNDRLDDEAVTLIVQAGIDIVDGDTFVISDGIQRLTFEFNAITDTGPSSVTPGNVPVQYDASGRDPGLVARAVRNAINSSQVQNSFQLTAATGDSREAGNSSGAFVELFGNGITVNPGKGRFIKMDLVAEETFQGRETAMTIPVIDHVADTVTEVNSPNALARSAVSGYADGTADVLVGVGKIGDYVTTGEQFEDDPVIINYVPHYDTDSVRIYLKAGQTVDIDVDSAGWTRGYEVLDLPVISVFEASLPSNNFRPNRLLRTSLHTPSSAPGESTAGAFASFTAPADAYYDVMVSSANVWSNTSLEIPFFASAALLDGETFLIDVGGEQTKFQYTTVPGSFSPNKLILIDLADTPEVIAQKTQAVIAAEVASLNPTVEGAFVDLGDVDGITTIVVDFFTSPLFVETRAADYGEYALTIRPNAAASAEIPDRDVVMVDYQFGISDKNRLEDQGQIIISSNFISNSGNYGIVAAAGDRTPTGMPQPGSARLLRNENTGQLIPGAVIANNVVHTSGTGGILFSGDTPTGTEYAAPVPFGRLYNNTLVNSGGGLGIRVEGSASPTLLNNIVSGFNTGISVDASSRNAGTTVGANVFHQNATNSTLPLASSSIVIGNTTALFQDPARNLYIPAFGSLVIDSSVGSLPDRSDFFQTVKQPVGISPSPIIAPAFDAYGQQRVDDTNVQTPGGVGLNPSIDRGAIDRADVERPKAILTKPQDAVGVIVVGGDGDVDESFVRLSQGTVEFFEVQLRDDAGTGPDPATITNESVLLTENGRRMVEGIDYVFGYSANSRSIRLTPLAGLFRSDAVYEITLNNKQRTSLQLGAGDTITDGDQIVITDASGAQSVFEFESGYVFSIPQSNLITVRGTNAVFQDQQTFSIIGPSGQSRTFEINTAGSFSSNNVEVNLKSGGTVKEVRDAIVAALNRIQTGTSITVAEFLELEPTTIGLASNQLQLGTKQGHIVAGTVNGLEFSGVAASVREGESLTYTAGTESVTLQFTSDPMFLSDPSKIVFSAKDTPSDIATKVVAAFGNYPALGLGASQAIDGRVVLGGGVSDTLTFDVAASDTNPSSFTLEGVPGVTGALRMTIPGTATGSSLDGKRFIVTVDGVPVTFQYTTDPTLTSANRLILLGGLATPNQIAALTASEIDATFGADLNPSANGAVVLLGEQLEIPAAGVSRSLASINPVDSGVSVAGTSGGAIPVAFLPTDQFPASSTAATLQAAIRKATLDVNTFSPGGGTLLIEKAASIQSRSGGSALVDFGTVVPAIADLAGNPVLETRVNDETRFTIIMPDVLFDLGDAPVTYGTLFADNGARHTVGGDRTPRLGQFLDTEADGQPTAGANGDDQPLVVNAIESGGIFDIDASAANTITISVNASTPTTGQKLQVIVGGSVTTFELIKATDNAQDGNVPVIITATDTPAEVAAKMVTAINGRIAQTGDSLRVALKAKASPSDPAVDTFEITAVDDEDGVSIGTFNAPGGITLKVFTTPGTDPNAVSPSQVLGFVNPLDPAGSVMAVTATGAGLVDGWIDFDRDGIFQSNEQILTNSPVVNGINMVSFFAPASVAALGAGDTIMRLRISTGGNLGPVGVSVGGEVEDYVVSVLPVALPIPITDSYTATEDIPLVVDGGATSQSSLFDNDIGIGGQILPVRYFVGEQPAHGTVVVTNELTGEFTYTPETDYYGEDTFTYRLSTQQNNSPNAVSLSTFATVTINIAPVNDDPGASNQNFVTSEETTLRIPASALLSGATGHGDPAIPTPPFDESNQNLRVISITGGRVAGDPSSGTTISQSNADTAAITVEGGTLTATFAVDGSLTEVQYTPLANFNSDNLPLSGGGLRLDEFLFTVEDDGVLVTDSGNVNSSAKTVTATASIRVTPQNDAPFLATDSVSIDNPAYVNYFTSRGLTAPVPTEDQSLVIPAAFLLENDSSGPLDAADENQAIRGNDGVIRLINPVALVDPTLGTLTLGANGDLLFTPTADVYGQVLFTYTVIDQGVNEAVDGTRTSAPLTSTVTSTIFLEPVNDVPVAFNRSLTLDEVAEPAGPAVLTFTAADLINGKVGEQPNRGGNFAASLPAPYNETNQALRVVAFASNSNTVDVNSLAGGSGQLTLTTGIGGILTFDFTNGAFVSGTYAPPVDYNERTPFNPNDFFTYTIADDGATVFGGGIADRDLVDERSTTPATVTLTVTETNDPPVFQTIPVVDMLERDDSLSTTIPAFVFNQAAGPATALDEIDVQTLSFTIVDSLSTVPAGLMLQSPRVLADGSLEVFPAPDQFGTATYVVRATDAEPNNPAFNDPRSTDKTFVLNVRPVNDAPRLNASVLGTSGRVVPTGPNPIIDQAYAVGFDGTITYTLREDNTQALGDTSQAFFIPINRPAATSGYSQIGLLDVFTPGPANEVAALPGGSQTLELFDFPETTALGGQLTSVFSGGVLIGVNYVPPANFNNAIGSADTFTYTVRDKSSTGNETYSLAAGSLVPDRLTSINQVRLNLNPVNDRPEFEISRPNIEVPEDGAAVTINNYAFNINAGPPFNAFDEIDPNTGQDVTFTVTALGFASDQAAQFFSQFPSIDSNGRLTFRPAANAFGKFQFEIVATDNGPGNATRGDLISSLAKTMTIEIQPINDPPQIDPTVSPLQFTMLEDGEVEIRVRGDSTNPGLLDVFTVGPANEASNVTPGGNQTLSLGTPIPVTSLNGGTLTQVLGGSGEVVALRYKPRANFTGNDAIIYTVSDDGVTVDFGTGGTVRSNPRIASNTVAINVLPVNDAPIFSGAGDVVSIEDQDTGLGRGVVRVPNWATNVQAGPAGATDELEGAGAIEAQQTEFVITQISGNTSLFSVAPNAIINGSSATLAYTLAPDAAGQAVFTAQLRDNGPSDAAIGDDAVGDTQTFTISVTAVNDPPTFANAGDVTVDEDSGPYNAVWATQISPGPADESSQTVVFNVTVPEASKSLFASLPVISESGVLRFTPALNAVGAVTVVVNATDSGEAISPPVSFQIKIGEVNDPPRPLSDVLDPSDEDTVLTISAAQLLANDGDPDLQTNPNESLTLVMPAESTSVSGATVKFDAATQTITYNPLKASVLQALAPGKSLTDSFSYTVRDAAGVVSAPVVVRVVINGINDAPTLVADNPVLAASGSTVIRPLDNDSDIDGQIDPASVRLELQPVFGSVQIDLNGVMTYTPFASFSGKDTFSYSVADNLGLRSIPAVITIDANPAPIAKSDVAGTFVDEAVVIDVAANDSDENGTLNLASIRIVSAPGRGDAVPLADGKIRYIPATGFVGRDSFTYSIADNEGRFSTPATVSVQVVASRLQNPNDFSDVNADGDVSALDALLIINKLMLAGGNVSSIPVQPGDRGPNYFDVSGDRQISALDALQVINQLMLRGPVPASGSGELAQGESIAAASATATPLALMTSETVAVMAEPDSAFALAPRPDKSVANVADNSPADGVFDSSVDLDAYDWIDSDAVDLIADEREADGWADDAVSALDSAFLDFE